MLQRVHWYWQHKKKEAAKREAAGEEPEPDAEFDGGFKVPGDIFSRLFDYQKTGWYLSPRVHSILCVCLDSE